MTIKFLRDTAILSRIYFPGDVYSFAAADESTQISALNAIAWPQVSSQSLILTLYPSGDISYATDSVVIQNAINALGTAGGGVLSLAAGVYFIGTPLIPKSGVSIRGIIPQMNYAGGNIPDAAGTLPNAGGTIFNCNGGDGFAWNTAALGAPGSQLIFTQLALTNIEISGIGFVNVRNGVNSGNTNNASAWFSKFFDLYSGAATGWLFNMTNFQHCTFERLRSFGSVTGQLFFGNDVAAATLQPGNSTFSDLYGVTPSSNANLARGIVHFVTQGTQNQALHSRIQSNRLNAATVTQAATMVNAQTSIGVTDSTKFLPQMPVTFSATANGFTVNLTYFILTSAANAVTVALTMGGTAIAATGNTAVNIITQGFAALEFVALSGATFTAQTVLNIDVEGGGTSAIIMQNLSGGFFQVSQVPSAVQSTSSLMLRSVANTHIFGSNTMNNIDADNLSPSFYYGYLSANGFVNRALPGFTIPTGLGASVNLSSGIGLTYGLQSVSVSGNGLIVPVEPMGQRAIIYNVSTRTLSAADCGAITNQFSGAAWTLPAITSAITNMVYDVSNANQAGNLTISPTGQTFNNVTARTSLILTPGAGCRMTAFWDGTIGYWQVSGIAGTYAAGTITGI